MIAVGGLAFGAIRGTDRNWQDPIAWAALAIGFIALIAFPFLMAVLRDGRTVSQVGFTPEGRMTMTRADFVALSRRALDRLSNLPGHRR